MADNIKESHSLVKCPHCGGQIRLKARTLGDKTVAQALEESSLTPKRRRPKMVDDIMAMFDDIFGRRRG